MALIDTRHGYAGTANLLLELVVRGGLVKRFHTRDTIKENNVAQHSFGVAWFCFMLAEEAPTANLLLHALAHDLAEGIVGDVPAPTKKLPGFGSAMVELEETVLQEAGLRLPALSAAEKRMLKLADYLDGLLFCALEARRGNVLRTGYYDYLSQMAVSALERRLVNDVVDIFNAAVPRGNFLRYARLDIVVEEADVS